MNNNYFITLLLTIINLLSIILIGGLSFFLKSLWGDMKAVRSQIAILQTEHNIYKEICKHHHRRKDDTDGEEAA